MKPSMETRCVHGTQHAFEENTRGLIRAAPGDNVRTTDLQLFHDT